MQVRGYVVEDELERKRTEKKALGERRTEKQGKVEKKEKKRTEKKALDEKELSKELDDY